MIRTGLLLLSLYSTCVLAQKPVVANVEVKDGYHIDVTNPSYLPISMVFAFQLTNMRVEGGLDTVVVGPNTRQTVHRLVPVRPKSGYSFRYTYTYNAGDYRSRPYDTAYVYDLPFRGPTARRVMQGYNGHFSHLDKAALDFDLPEGTPVHAARSGRVTEVVNSNDAGCPDPVCMNFSNLVRIVHSDGTIAEYVHLRKEGATVEVGEKVTAGDLIGYSGNTGYSSAPHLHFAVYQQRFNYRLFLPTAFRTTFGEGVLLVEGERYTAEN
ncbi:MAG: M23 family metallopeptidase [Lewinella sp.]